MAGALISPVEMRQLAEAVVEQGTQFVHCLGRSVPDAFEERRDSAEVRGHWETLQENGKPVTGYRPILRRLLWQINPWSYRRAPRAARDPALMAVPTSDPPRQACCRWDSR